MQNKTEIQSLEQLGLDLMKVYAELRAGSIEEKTADALANVAGKVIGSAKVILEAKSWKGELGHIPLVDNQKRLKTSRDESNDITAEEISEWSEKHKSA